MINIAIDDPLKMEARHYAARLIANGVDVEVRQYHQSRHGFIIAGIDESDAARERIFEWLGNRLMR